MQAVRGSRLVHLGLATLGLVLVLGVGAAISAAPEFELAKRFGPDGTEATGFTSADSVAIDQENDSVYVLSQLGKKLFKFDAGGEPVNFAGTASYISGNEISGVEPFGSVAQSQVAVNSSSHLVYVTSGNAVRAFEADGEPFEFSAGPGAGTSEIGGFKRLIGVATDQSGNIYASDVEADKVSIFDPTGALITQFETTDPANLAVDVNGAIYLVRWQSTVRKFTPSQFPVTPSTTYAPAASPLSEKNANAVAVDLPTNHVYVTQSVVQASGPEAKIVVYDEDGASLGFFAGAGEEGEVFTAEGIAIHADDRTVFAANNPASGLRQVEVFASKDAPEPERPFVEYVSASGVSSSSANLSASIDPNLSETTYRFEYGPEDCSVSPCTSVPVGGASIGAGSEAVKVSRSIGSLEPDSTYHYRVVAENELGDNLEDEADHTFTTQGLELGFDLADLRAWEMVSPPNKRGALLFGLAEGQIQSAVDGNGLAYISGGSIEADPVGSRSSEMSSVLAKRGEASWSSQDITPPNIRTMPVGKNEYKLFSPDLSLALLQPKDGTGLSPEASERTPYIRSNTSPPSYRPIVTGKEGFANVPPGTVFGGDIDSLGSVLVEGATSDLEHVVVTSAASLAPGAPVPSLYKWSDGDLEVQNVLPAAEGGGMVASNILGAGEASVRNAISSDGSRVFWTAQASHRLYLRESDAGETARIDVVQPGGSGIGAEAPRFQGASTDGTSVLFTDSQQLTEGASPSGSDLYRCVIPDEAPLTGCSSLVNLTPPKEGSGESAEVLGVLPAISDDGAMAYFVAKGALEALPNEAAQEPVSGEPNLYLWTEGNGLRFIATLSPEDKANWGMPGTSPGKSSDLSAASSPSGRYFAFMSRRSLTGADNRDALTGEPIEQVFRYDAVSGQLHCVSCNPTGAASRGITVDGNNSLVDPRDQWFGQRVAATLPQSTVINDAGNSLYRPRAVLDNGRIFFNAVDALVTSDSNGQWDVYQYEDVGVGDCSSSSGNGAIAGSGEGCVSLISSGGAKKESGFLDASVDGDDAFFLTPARLSVLDKDDEPDIYDARVNGKTAVLEPTSECLGEGCRAPSLQEAAPLPASASFSGAGNAKDESGRKCPKGKRKVKREGKVRCLPRKQSKQSGKSGKGNGKRRGR